MKVAITSTGNSLESKLDSRFGRCSFFVIYDTESNRLNSFQTRNKENVEGAARHR
jgi:predicted Fe-Mo cluster-binding NifX family protein